VSGLRILERMSRDLLISRGQGPRLTGREKDAVDGKSKLLSIEKVVENPSEQTWMLRTEVLGLVASENRRKWPVI